MKKLGDRVSVAGWNKSQANAATVAARKWKVAATEKDTLANSPESGKILSKTDKAAHLQTSEALRKNIADKLGVAQDAIQIGKLPLESQQIISDSVSMVIDRFPQLKGHTKSIKYDDTLQSIASSRSIVGEIKVGPDFLDLEKLKKNYSHDIKLKFHPKGTEDLRSIIVHELGHQIDGLLTLNGVYKGTVTQYGVVRSSKEIRREVLDKMGLTFERMKEIRAEYRAQGLAAKDLNHAVNFERREFIEKHISDYANENEREFFAECFAEYMVSDTPREAAKILGEVVERLMGGL